MTTVPTRQCAGLTLVEMLVVVALLAVMLGILLPALDRARALAHRTECMENQQLIGKGFQNFVADEGTLPRARYLAAPIISHDPNPALPMVLVGRMPPSSGMFLCPGDDMQLYPVCGISYYYNFMLAGRSLESVTAAAHPPLAPADLPLLWDADNIVFESTQGPIRVPCFHEVRVGLFADGHVQTVTDDQTPM